VSQTVVILLDASYALAVVGAALSPWPWTALVVAAAYLLGQAVLLDRRSVTP
jgi:hypothetical protein